MSVCKSDLRKRGRHALYFGMKVFEREDRFLREVVIMKVVKGVCIKG